MSLKSGVFRYLMAWFAGCALLLGAPVAQADEAAEEVLARFVNSVSTFEAAFEQRQSDEYGDLLQESRGRFWLERPGRFRWEVQEPYPQLLVSDGESLWFYDPDLAQATRRPAEQALAGTPAALLAEGQALTAAYTLRRVAHEGRGELIELTPRRDDGDFRFIRLRLVDDVPVDMHFEDQLGGSTEVRFSEVRVNQPVDAGLLRFEPPRGTEVVELQ